MGLFDDDAEEFFLAYPQSVVSGTSQVQLNRWIAHCITVDLESTLFDYTFRFGSGAY